MLEGGHEAGLVGKLIPHLGQESGFLSAVEKDHAVAARYQLCKGVRFVTELHEVRFAEKGNLDADPLEFRC